MDGEPMVGGIPQMGYGTWTHYGENARDCVAWAIEAGCRHIDTAQGYDNERAVALGIAQSGVPRSEIFITTKVRPDNFGPGQVMPSVRESLDKLETDVVDLLLLHWPSRTYPLESYIGQLAEAFDAGLAKRIGVSNFNKAQIDQTAVLLGDRKIATNQVEAHVYMQNRPIVEHCQAMGIPVTAYCPVARGAIVGDPVLAEIGAAHDVSGDQVALAFLMAKGMIVIPSSGKKARIVSNFEARRIALTPDEVARLEGLDRGMRIVSGGGAVDWDV